MVFFVVIFENSVEYYNSLNDSKFLEIFSRKYHNGVNTLHLPKKNVYLEICDFYVFMTYFFNYFL